MIRMRSNGGSWSARPAHSYARFLVAIVTALAIAAIAYAMRPADRTSPVMRVALDRVPEGRVVNFGHEMPRIAKTDPAELAMDIGALAAPQERPLEDLAKADIAPVLWPEPKPDIERSALQRLEPDENGLLPIDFKLQEGVSSKAGGVGVAKTIAAEGGQATGLTIFLIGGSLIEVDRVELVAALAALGAKEKAGALPLAGDNGRLSLDRVRTAGLDLRYDAIQDRLVLRP